MNEELNKFWDLEERLEEIAEKYGFKANKISQNFYKLNLDEKEEARYIISEQARLGLILRPELTNVVPLFPRPDRRLLK